MKSSARGRGTPLGSRPKHAAARGDVSIPKNPVTQDVKPRFSPLWLPALLTLIFAGFALLPRVNANPGLNSSFWASAAFLLAGLGALWWNVARTGRTLTFEFVPRPVHWVQMIMHSSVYAYWGWYWREVYHEIPLIAAQVVFLYVLDMLVCWFRRDNWILGFGPIPIILSMNLFLWFRDDWFYLQFVMVAIIVFGKEFVKWKRDGHLTHIFNPSAFALFLTSIVLLATRSTAITWGAEISTTFNNPPNIYLEIFLLGLVVQGLFSVTLVTLVRGSHALSAGRRLPRFHRHVPFHRLQHPPCGFPGAASPGDGSGDVSPQEFREVDLRRGLRRRRIRLCMDGWTAWDNRRFTTSCCAYLC